MGFLLKNGLIVTNNSDRDIIEGDLLIKNNEISDIGADLRASLSDEIIDVSNQFVIPGFIQTHTHLCQALYRGYADDLSLLKWLEDRIWPMEAGHNSESIKASAQISLLEMHLLGTTSILDMGTVNYTQSLLEEVEISGMRYWGGKCLMDLKETSGPLYENTDKALSETKDLISQWNNKNELINYAICPRFAISCSDTILNSSYELAQINELKFHTHASENKDEVQMIRDRTGFDNVEFFDQLELLGPNTIIVHGVHLTDHEIQRMVDTKTPLVHCPSANLKLASGIAPIVKYQEKGLIVGLGSDGAPCNNTMDPFMEMRLAALIQKPSFGPEALPAQTAFEMATLNGAKVLGLEDKIGSLQIGKLADVVTVDRSHPSVGTVQNPYSALVYSSSGRDVKNVFINGKSIVRNGQHKIYKEQRVIALAKEEIEKLKKRI